MRRFCQIEESTSAPGEVALLDCMYVLVAGACLSRTESRDDLIEPSLSRGNFAKSARRASRGIISKLGLSEPFESRPTRRSYKTVSRLQDYYPEVMSNVTLETILDQVMTRGFSKGRIEEVHELHYSVFGLLANRLKEVVNKAQSPEFDKWCQLLVSNALSCINGTPSADDVLADKIWEKVTQVVPISTEELQDPTAFKQGDIVSAMCLAICTRVFDLQRERLFFSSGKPINSVEGAKLFYTEWEVYAYLKKHFLYEAWRSCMADKYGSVGFEAAEHAYSGLGLSRHEAGTLVKRMALMVQDPSWTFLPSWLNEAYNAHQEAFESCAKMTAPLYRVSPSIAQ